MKLCVEMTKTFNLGFFFFTLEAPQLFVKYFILLALQATGILIIIGV